MEREREGLGGFLRRFGSDHRMFPSLFGERNPLPFSRVTHKEKGIVIEELDSDHNEEDNANEKSKSSEEPSIEHPDDDVGLDVTASVVVPDRKSKRMMNKGTKPQSRSYSFHSCKVTYGGVNGAYYTSTSTRKEGSDGVVMEETKEADKTTGQAQHRISRGIHDKGHSVTRKLNSDGKVDTLQTLHNLDEGELAGFEEAWNDNKGEFPGWDYGFGAHGPWFANQKRDTISGSWFLPSSGEAHRARWTGSKNEPTTKSQRAKKVVRINID